MASISLRSWVVLPALVPPQSSSDSPGRSRVRGMGGTQFSFVMRFPPLVEGQREAARGRVEAQLLIGAGRPALAERITLTEVLGENLGHGGQLRGFVQLVPIPDFLFSEHDLFQILLGQ